MPRRRSSRRPAALAGGLFAQKKGHMMSVSTPSAKANGAATVFNVITAPREAFVTLRAVPMWGWALIVSLVLTLIGEYLATPATLHAMQAGWPAQIAANPQLAALSPDKQQHILAMTLGFVKFAWLISPIYIFFGALIATVIMLIFKALGRGDAGFKQLWCAAMNVGVVSMGIYFLIDGLIDTMRGAASFNSTSELYRIIPGLSWLAPAGAVKATAFLAAFNVIGIWAAVLIALAMIHVAKTSKVNAALCAVATLVVTGGFLAWGAH